MTGFEFTYFLFYSLLRISPSPFTFVLLTKSQQKKLILPSQPEYFTIGLIDSRVLYLHLNSMGIKSNMKEKFFCIKKEKASAESSTSGVREGGNEKGKEGEGEGEGNEEASKGEEEDAKDDKGKEEETK